MTMEPRRNLPTTTEKFSHAKTAADSTWKLFTTRSFCDVKFLVGSDRTEVRAHKLLLMARSPVFSALFADRWAFDGNGDSMTEVNVDEEDPQVFELFLKFIYTDEFDPNIMEACSLFQLAHLYDVEPLRFKCEEFISNNFPQEQALEVFQWARSYSLNNLMEKTGAVIARSFPVLLKDTNYLGILDQHTLIHLLKRDDLAVAEIIIFEIACNWASIQASKTGQNVQELLRGVTPFIRFPLMDIKEFIRAVVPMNILPNEDVISLFTFFNADVHNRKLLASTLPYSSHMRSFAGTQTAIVKLYKQHTSAHRPDIRSLPPAWEFDFHETISFVYDFASDPIAGSSYNAHLVGLTLKTPDYDFNTSTVGYSGSSDYYINLTIHSENLRPNQTTESQRTKLTHGIESKLKLVQPVPLHRFDVYTIKILFESRVVLKERDHRAKLINNFDEFNNSFVPETVAHEAHHGLIKLSNVKFAAKSQSIFVGLHVIKDLEIEFV